MTRRVRQSALVLLSTLALLVTQPPAGGYSYFTWGGVKVTWYGNQSLRYLSPTTFPPNSATDLLYRNAMGLWGLVPGANFTYFYQRLPQDYPLDHYDGYSDTIAVPASQLDPGVLGVTYMVNNGAYWFDMDMVFADYPAGAGWNFAGAPACHVVSAPAAHGFSFLLVATHELGHALGLGHDPLGSEAPGATWFIGTMNPRYPAGGPVGSQNIVELHADDRGGLRFLYPRSGASTPQRDVANSGYIAGPQIGKAIPATFTPTTIAPGGVLTLRGTVENFGNRSVLDIGHKFFLSTDPVIDASDYSLGEVRWDIALGDAIEFDVSAEMPSDLGSGTYYLGSILDPADELPEIYEDNNTHVYCAPLTVPRLPPRIHELGQALAACGVPFTGPAPRVTHPLNMAPITWSLDNPPPGMTINPSSGVIHWPRPVRSPFLYTLIVRATNSAGFDTVTFYLGVDQGPPTIQPIAPQSTPHTLPYTGPTPQLTDPPCMTPILNWSLDAGPPGMQIDHATGVVSWSRPRYRATPYTVSIRATNAVGNGVRTWHLTVTGLPGDLNCDGARTFDDIDPFVLALAGEAAYAAQYPGCDRLLADCNGDGDVNFNDIAAFVALIGH